MKMAIKETAKKERRETQSVRNNEGPLGVLEVPVACSLPSRADCALCGASDPRDSQARPVRSLKINALCGKIPPEGTLEEWGDTDAQTQLCIMSRLPIAKRSKTKAPAAFDVPPKIAQN